jgi:outer membrane lipopolysaccharide assembly protein LptE/RlpB
MRGRFAGWMALAGTLAFLRACGYSFSGSSLPSHIRSLAIPVLENKSLDYQVADEATQALVDRFIQDNRLKVVPLSAADAVLEGAVTSYENKVYSYTREEEPEQYIVVIHLSLAFKDLVKNREIWKEEDLVASAVYSPGGLVPGGPTTEEEARAKALEELANDVLSRTLERW